MADETETERTPEIIASQDHEYRLRVLESLAIAVSYALVQIHAKAKYDKGEIDSALSDAAAQVAFTQLHYDVPTSLVESNGKKG